MKNSIKYLLLSAAALAAVSCESWLDVTPPSEIRAEAHYSSAEGFQQTLIGCYLAMGKTDLYGENLTWHMVEMLGRQYDARKNTAADDYDLDRYNYKTTKSTEVIEKVWEKSYSVIANVNDALDHIDRRKDGLDSVNYRIIKGELLAVRAYIHFDLMRLFGGDRIQNMMEKFDLDEDTPIENKMLTRAIENAQTTVESRNFQSRKSVLEYDDVMNKQREIIYAQRRQVLDGLDIKETVLNMMHTSVSNHVALAFGENQHLDAAQYHEMLKGMEGIYFAKGAVEFSDDEIPSKTQEDFDEAFISAAEKTYEAKEQEVTPPIMRELERVVMLRVVDEYWMDNIDAMDDLKQGIGLRAYGQHDPVIAYKEEGYQMFESMIQSIKEETVRRMFLVRIQPQQEVKREKVAKETGAAGANDGSVVKKAPVRTAAKKVGPNDPCPCGSGKKYKKCCMQKDKEAEMQQ